MSIILRVDDFPGTKPDEFWKHNLDNFKKFDDVLGENGVRQYTLGVIPKYLDERQIDWLASNERIRVALHGIEHDERFLNEFREHETQEDIQKKLSSACTNISRCNGDGRIRCYIPPHNVVDLKTARALAFEGFDDLMCGPGTDETQLSLIRSSGLFDRGRVTFSEHPLFYGRTDEMIRAHSEKAIEDAFVFPEVTVVTLHWTWEHNIGFSTLKTFMKRVGPLFSERS